MLPDRQVPTYSPALGAWLRKLSVALGPIGPRSAPGQKAVRRCLRFFRFTP